MKTSPPLPWQKTLAILLMTGIVLYAIGWLLPQVSDDSEWWSHVFPALLYTLLCAWPILGVRSPRSKRRRIASIVILSLFLLLSIGTVVFFWSSVAPAFPATTNLIVRALSMLYFAPSMALFIAWFFVATLLGITPLG